MAQFRVGCVPYVNARPLIAAFDSPNEFVEVVYDVPSRLPALLDSGEVDAILVSSIELLRRNDLLPVADVGIMSYGPVQSVRLLSKVPLNEIKSLALDQSSMTSNILAQIILAEQGVFPTTETLSPDAPTMLAHHDACVIIGDKGFEADGTGLVDIDLGQAWTNMTDLPFVWALWLGRKESKLEARRLSAILHLGYKASGFDSLHHQINKIAKSKKSNLKSISISMPGGEDTIQEWVDKNADRRQFVFESAKNMSSWSSEQIEGYLSNAVRYSSSNWLKALNAFRNYIEKHQLCELSTPELTYFELQAQISALIPSATIQQEL